MTETSFASDTLSSPHTEGAASVPSAGENRLIYSVPARFENRNLDFTPDFDHLVTSNSATNGNQIFLLDSDGELFVGRIAP